MSDEAKGLAILGGAMLALGLFVCGLYGFEQSYGISVFAALLAMLWCSLGTSALLYYGLRRETRARAKREPNYVIGFLGAVSVFALLQMATNPAAAYKADNELTRFATCWWVCFPLSAVFAVFADRAVLLVKKTKPQQREDREVEKEQYVAKILLKPDSAFKFDPARFGRRKNK